MIRTIKIGLMTSMSAFFAASAFCQTPAVKTQAPSAPINTMTYTLKLWSNEKLIHNPTEADIKAAVTGLNSSDDGPRLVLSTAGNTNELQVSGSPKGGFSFDYHEGLGDNYPLYVSKKSDYSADAVIKLFDAYLKGGSDWKSQVEWQKQ
jgi:hypothetical protein